METGSYGLAEWADLERILEAIGATEMELQTIRRQYDIAQLDPSSYAFMTALGVAPKQRQLAELEKSSRLIRVYQTAVFPGLLQTFEYAMSIFRALGHDAAASEDAARERLGRQAVLRDPNKMFRFVINEAVLYSIHEAGFSALRHLAQLEYFRSQVQVSNIDIRILEATKGVPLGAGNPFCIFDRRYVTAETTVRELVSTHELEVREYESAFASLSKACSRPGEVYELLDRAIAQFRS